MNLIIDIGNTHTKIGWFDRGKLIRHKALPIHDMSIGEYFNQLPVERTIISVAGKADPGFLKGLPSPVKALYLDHTTPLPIKVLYETPETLGRDRIAAAAGAWSIFPGSNLLIIDLGTAITIDFITSSGEYKGGNISPGLQTRFRSLHEYTANLPMVEKDSTYPFFGTSTILAIAAGVQAGIAFELNGYLNEFESRYPDCKFLLTGGDAGFFVPTLKKAIFANPDLVMIGLNHILEFNFKA